MRYILLVCLTFGFYSNAGTAGPWETTGGILESQEQTNESTPVVKASSEAERMAWNKVAREEDHEKKAKAAEKYLEKFSDGAYAPYSHEIIAVYALESNDIKKFKKHAELAVAGLPESIMLEVELAKIYAEEQNPESAIKHGERVLPILSSLVASDKTVAKDLEKYRLSMIADTNYALGTAYLYKGLNSRSRQAINRGIAYLETAAQLKPLDERSHFRLAFGYQVTRRIDQALNEYARAAALEGANARLAREYLEKAYLKKHGSLEGLEAFIEEQKGQLMAPGSGQ